MSIALNMEKKEDLAVCLFKNFCVESCKLENEDKKIFILSQIMQIVKEDIGKYEKERGSLCFAFNKEFYSNT